MKKTFTVFFACLFLTQISNAQNFDAKNLPLRIQEDAGGNGWSPDGKLFVTVTKTENKTKLWNLDTNAVIWEVSLDRLKNEKDILNSQTFLWSDSQKFILVRDAENSFYLLEAASGSVVWKNQTSRKNLEVTIFSPDKKRIIAVFSDEKAKTKIEFWSVADGRLQASLDSAVKFFDSFSFSKNGKFLLFGNFEGKAAWVNSSNGKILKNIALKPCGGLRDKFSRNAEFSPKLTYLVARCGDRTVVTNTTTGKIVRVLKMNTDSDKTIGFSDDENTLILGDSGGYKIFRFSDKTEKDVDFDLWFSVSVNRDGTLLANNSDYRKRGIEIVEVNSGKVLKNFESHPGEIKNLVFNPDGSRFASASGDGVVRVWETESRKLIWAKFANDEGTNVVAFSPDGKILVSSGDNESDINPIKVWNAENGNLLREVTTENEGNDGIQRMNFSRDGKMLLTTGDAVRFKLWDAENWRVLKTFQTYEEHRSGNTGWCCGSKALTATFDKSGKRILSAHEDGTAKIWEIEKVEPIKIFKVSEYAVHARFSPDEKQILVAGASGNQTKLIDAETGNIVREFKTGNSDEELNYVTDAAFRNDGKIFFTTSWFDDVMLWDAESGKLLKRIDVGWSTEDEIEISPNGRRFLAGGKNQNIMLFDAEIGSLIWSLFPINKELRRIKQAEEDKRIAFVKWQEQYAARADVDNRERAKKITAKFSHYGEAESFWDQKIAESGAPKKSKLKLSREKASVAWFALTNVADLPVSIDTNSMIFNPKCRGLCNDSEISSRYAIEFKNGVTNVNGIDSYSKTILPPKTTVYFSVVLEHLRESKAIWLGFTFQKENPDDKDSDDYGTEQKIYLRETDFPK